MYCNRIIISNRIRFIIRRPSYKAHIWKRWIFESLFIITIENERPYICSIEYNNFENRNIYRFFIR